MTLKDLTHSLIEAVERDEEQRAEIDCALTAKTFKDEPLFEQVSVSKAVPLLESLAVELASGIDHRRVNQMTDRVRAIDEFRTGLEAFKDSIKTSDLSGACQFYKKIKGQEDVITQAYDLYQMPSLDPGWGIVTDSGSTFLESTRSLLLKEIDTAILEDDSHQSVLQKVGLYGAVDATSTGVNRLSELLSTLMMKQYQGKKSVTLASKSEYKQLHLLSCLFETAADTIASMIPKAQDLFGSSASLIIQHKLSGDVDVLAGPILDAWMEDRKIGQKIAEASEIPTSPDPAKNFQIDDREMDVALNEMAAIFEKCNTYFTFQEEWMNELKESSPETWQRALELGTSANLVIQEDTLVQKQELDERLLQLQKGFLIVEEVLIRRNFDKAISRDTATGNALTSSCVDDVFYLVKRSIERVMASESSYLLASVIRICSKILQRDYGDFLHKSCMSQETQTRALNNLEMSVTDYMPALIRQIARDREKWITTSIQTARNELRSLLQQMHDMMFSSARDPLVKTLRDAMRELGITSQNTTGLAAVQIAAGAPPQPGLRYKTMDESFLDGPHYVPLLGTEPRLRQTLERFFEYYKARLLPSNFNGLLLHTAECLAEQLEVTFITLRFTPIGAILLEKDVRSLVSFLTSHVQDPISSSEDSDQEDAHTRVRNTFSALQFFVGLMMLISLEDVEDYLKDWQSITQALTEADVKKMLSLRSDFETLAPSMTLVGKFRSG